MQRLLWLILVPFLLAGCDQLSERAGFPNAAKIEAEGKAIGGACRHAGRGLEDCYRLNRGASKAAVFAGWKEMNEYMLKNEMSIMEPSVGPHAGAAGGKTTEAAPADKPAEKTDKPAEKTDKPAEKPAEPTLKPASPPAPKAETGKPATPAAAAK